MSVVSLRPDPVGQCLMLCTAARWRPEAMTEALALAQTPGFDWGALAGLAQTQEMAPLLYAALREQSWAPAPLLHELHTAYMRNGSRNALLLAELESVLATLTAAGIPVLVLKGAALILDVYDNLALRPMVDLDLLLRRADLPIALAMLATSGYRTPQTEPAAGLALEFENQLLLRRADRIDLLLELHWSLFDSPYYQRHLPMSWFWETSTPVRISATSTRILGPEAELLHLCGHLALHHRGKGMLWHHDIAATIARGREMLDWDALLTRARDFDLVLPLQTLLPRIAREWGAPIPAVTLTRLEAMRPSPDEARVFAQLTAERRPVVQRFQADLAGIPAWRDRLRYAWVNLVPAPAYMRERYAIPHPALLPTYYPYRWFVGLREALQSRKKS